MRRQTQLKLLEELKDIHKNLLPRSSKELINRLKTIKNIFREELSASRNNFYAEFFDGIILAVSQFSQVDDRSRDEMLNLCKELLIHIHNELFKETEIKIDIVFLPYKVSMWDSLESIWQAAFDDKDHCNTFVIPIPYAERNPDQTVASWHCESKLYPKYVPVIDYRKFNLEKFHPDVIFIHNPYDNYNSLTSVDSNYYSDKLKLCCDKLIYVPYFVAKDVKPGDLERENNIAHLILTQGVYNSDLVFVQSENIRQVYINVLTRYTNKTDPDYWRPKIIGIGSPKFDKVSATYKDDLKIPNDWLKIIKKSDGSFKKIFFYNSGVSLALRLREKLLNKIEDDFRIFKENSDEVALIWRPHPLMLATFAGMLPEYQKRYESIVQKYKLDGFGIYDDTSDANLAMTLSDAYYGDGSSLLRLYEVTGKPIMTHVCRVSGKLNKIFKISHAHYEDKNIFCTMLYDPNLYKINLETKTIEFVTKIFDDDENLHSFINITTYENFFILIQSSTCKLILMNRENFTKEQFQIPSLSDTDSKFSQYNSVCFIRNDNLYIFGINFRGIIKFNLKSKQFKIIDEFLQDLKITSSNEILCLRDYIEVDDKIYFPLVNSNLVLELSADDSTVIHYVGDDKQNYMSGTFDGKNFWLIPRNAINGKIIKWNPSDDTTKIFETPFTDEQYSNKSLLSNTFKVGNQIIIMSLRGINSNIKINIDTDELTLFDDFFDARFNLGSKYPCMNFENDTLTYIEDFNLIRHNFKTDSTEKIKLQPSEDVIKIIDKYFSARLKIIFSPKDKGLSQHIPEQDKLNLCHLIEYLKIK